MRRRGISNAGFGGLAAAAMLVAHWLAYLVAAPNSHERAELLAASGHRYWIYVAAAGLGAGALAMARFVRSRLHDDAGRSRSSLIGAVALRLAAIQTIMFIALEGIERLATGHAFIQVFSEPVVLIGIVLQLVVAVLGAFLLAVVAIAIDRIKDSLHQPRAETPIWGPTLFLLIPRCLVAAGSGTLRGPPVSV
jgi:hypothetical protein